MAPAEPGAADLTHLLIGANRPGARKPVGLDAMELDLASPPVDLAGLSLTRGS
jgi:hypothetical protein